MKETTKSSTTSMVGDFDEENPSGHHVHIHNHYNIHHHHHYHNQNEANGGEEKESKQQQHCLKESLPVNDTPSNGDEEKRPIEITPPAETLYINPTLSASLDLVHSPTNKPYVGIQSAANHEYFLSVRDGKVIFASFDPYDESQHWYKEENIGTTTARPFFYLVNKSTGQAIKYSNQDKYSVQLITYNPQVLDKSTLWMLSFGYNNRIQEVAAAGDYMRLSPFSNSRVNLAAPAHPSHIDDGDPVQIGWYDYRDMLPHMWRVIHYCDSV